MFSMQDRIQGFDDALRSAPAATTRAFGIREVTALAGWICDLLDHVGDASTVDRVRREAEALCARFPVYGTTTVSGSQRRTMAAA